MSQEYEEEQIPDTAGNEPERKRLDPGFKRNLKILGGAAAVVVLIVGALAYVGRGKHDANLQSGIDLTGGRTVPQDGTVPTAIQEKSDRVDRAQSQQAAMAGQSYVPPPAAGQPVAYGSDRAASQAVAGAGTQVVYVNQQPQPQQNGSQSDALQRQVQRIAAVMSPGDTRVSIAAQTSNQGRQVAPATQTSPKPDAAVSTIAKATLVPDFEIYAAEVTNDVSTDRGGFTSVRINSGPAMGGVLEGKSTLVGGEYLSTNLTVLKLKGETYSVSAKLVDEETSDRVIRADLDRKIFTRYVMPIAIAGVQKFFDARSQTGSYVTNGVPASGGGVYIGTTGIATPAPSTQQAVDAGIAKGLEMANQGVSKSANEPPDAKLRFLQSVGVVFLAPVVAK